VRERERERENAREEESDVEEEIYGDDMENESEIDGEEVD
jgi:hypothetical protein